MTIQVLFNLSDVFMRRRTISMFRIVDIIFGDYGYSVNSLIHVFVKVLNDLFLCLAPNINMCIIYEIEITVVWYYPSIFYYLTTDSYAEIWMHKPHIGSTMLNIAVRPKYRPSYWKCNDVYSIFFCNNRKYLPKITYKHEHFSPKYLVLIAKIS